MITFETTPNPNALKCVSKQEITAGIKSFRKPEDASCELSKAIFEIPGVTSLLMNGNWITVNKSPDAKWAAIKPKVTEILKAQ